MSGVVLDASAVIAFAKAEPGADVVESRLQSGAVCGAANWSEVVQKLSSTPFTLAATRAILQSYGVAIVPVTSEDAERAAELWHRGDGMSLADRLCVALAERLELPALTADRAWEGKHSRVEVIR